MIINSSTIPAEDFEQVCANISDAILNYRYWGHRDSNFFNCCCMHCGVIRYYDLSLDFYRVKKDCYDLLFCKDCWEEIERQHIMKRKGVKFETEKYVYEQVIKEIESPDLERC